MRSYRPALSAFALAAAILTAVAAPAVLAGGRRVIFTLDDPRGDDHGGGTLVYPLRDDLTPGELDLIRLRAVAEEGGTTFEATFAKPVRPTGRRTIDIGGGNLDDVCRFNFYTLNIDIYIDTDRIPGSGSTNTLPGRVAKIAEDSAWEKVVCLTPRPYDAQDALHRLLIRSVKRDAKSEKKKIKEEDLDRLRAEAREDIASKVFFPTRIKVAGRTISFFVPDSFLGGPARDTWSYVIAVTGADYVQRFDLTSALGSTPSEGPGLMILPIGLGRSERYFGGAREGEGDYQPPLLDIVVPPGRTQEQVLEDYDLDADRSVRLPGVVPASLRSK